MRWGILSVIEYTKKEEEKRPRITPEINPLPIIFIYFLVVKSVSLAVS